MESLRAKSWLAIKGKSAGDICRDLDLRLGKTRGSRRMPLEGALSDAGWFLIVGEGWDHRLIQPPVLTRVSAGCEVLTCTVEERNLSSAASGWRNGRRIWSVSYEGEDRPGEVLAEGELPVTFEAIRQDFTSKSQADDAGDLLLDPLFEIAIETVRAAIGYRPDEESPAFDGRFAELTAINPTMKQRLFGG
jgi:hypothetical protein